MAALEKLRLAETDANRIRKLNAIVDALNALGIGDGIIDASALPIATTTTPGIVTVGTGLSVNLGVITSP